jgi:hypothetical protein
VETGSDIIPKTDWPSEVAILVVAYNPEQNLVLQWQGWRQKGYPVWIWDNSPVALEGPKELLLGYRPGGFLGQALPSALTQLQNKGYSHVLYWDQDTRWNQDTLNCVSVCYRQQSSTDGESEWLHFSGNPRSHKTLVWLRHTEEGSPESETVFPASRPVSLVVNSGSLWPIGIILSRMQDMKLFDMDVLDYQMCWAFSFRGGRIRSFSDVPGLFHPLHVPGKALRVSIGAGKIVAWRHKSHSLRRRLNFYGNLVKMIVLTLTKGSYFYSWLFTRNLFLGLGVGMMFRFIIIFVKSVDLTQNLVQKDGVILPRS